MTYAPPDFTLKVRHDTRLPEAEQLFPHHICDRLNAARIGVPDDRIRYFLSEAPQFRDLIGGWEASFEDVIETENGLLVDLNVTANYGGGFYDSTRLIERYLITDDEVDFVGAWVPENAIPHWFCGG